MSHKKENESDNLRTFSSRLSLRTFSIQKDVVVLYRLSYT